MFFVSHVYGAESKCTSGSARRFDKIFISYDKAVKKELHCRYATVTMRVVIP